MTGDTRTDEGRLAAFMLDGISRRPEQMFGAYFEGRSKSDAFGAAYEGIYRLPADATGIRPRGLYKFFDCLDNGVRRCPADCHKLLMLDSLIIHLNDDHQWSRERIARWLNGEPEPQPAPEGPPEK